MKRTPLERWISGKIGKELEPLTRERIGDYQLLKLQETLTWAKTRSAFYRRHLADVANNRLGSLEDLHHIPFTTAKDLKQNPLAFLCVSQGEINRVVTLHTSGTTGEPKRLYFTGADQELTVDFFHRGMSTLIGPGERVLILLPGERPGSVGDLLAAGLQRLGASGVVYGLVQNYSHALEVMVKDSIDALVGIPAQVLALARHSGGRAAPRSVLLSTDHVPDAIRRELERIWGCEVYTHYGMTEMGFGGGVECQAKHGYHMREADLYVEIINPTTGARLEDGKTGEVVFTTLTRRGMPLIRYRTGDLSRFLLEPCPCGTALKTLERLKGRLEDRVELAPGRTLTIADLDEVLFRIRDLVDFSAAFVREKDLHRLNITTTMMERNSKGRTAEEVEMALQSIPALRSAVDEGALTVSVAVGVGGFTASNSSSKRRITGGKGQGVAS